MFELLASAFQSTQTRTEWQAQLGSIDQDALAISAIVLGLAPLLHWRLGEWNLSLEPRAMAKLAAARETARQQRAALDAQLETILSALAARRIHPLLLKGSYLAASVYPEPHLRQMNDIDILVQPDDLTATENALTALGYVGSYKSSTRGAGVTKHTSTFRPPRADDATPNPYLSSAVGRTIEPHTLLEESWYGLRADITPGVWARSIPFQVHSHSARALCADDLVLHLAVHLTFHLIMGYPSMVQLLDLVFVTSRLDSEIDWNVVVARANAQHTAPYVYAALALAQKTLDAPIPFFVLEKLDGACSARVRRYVRTLSLAHIVARSQRAPVSTFGQRVQRGWQDRVEVARWASSPLEQWRVWRTMLDILNTDTGELIMQRTRAALLRLQPKKSSAGSHSH